MYIRARNNSPLDLDSDRECLRGWTNMLSVTFCCEVLGLFVQETGCIIYQYIHTSACRLHALNELDDVLLFANICLAGE